MTTFTVASEQTLAASATSADWPQTCYSEPLAPLWCLCWSLLCLASARLVSVGPGSVEPLQIAELSGVSWNGRRQ